MIPAILELGGKNMAIVDCSSGTNCVNLDLAAKRIAWGRFINAGQTCVAPDFVICVDGGIQSRTDELIDALCRRTRSLFGSSTPELLASNSYGRLVSENAVRRCETLINQHRANIVFGGDVDVQQRFVSPTIINASNIPLDSALMTEEIFAPILPVCRVATVEDAIDLANQYPSPLAMYTFSKSRAFQNACLNGIRSGGACVNDALLHFVNSHVPFGGFGASGIGKYHGKYSFEAFTHPRATIISSSLSCLDLPVRYPPYDKSTEFIIGSLNCWNSI